jgi:ribosomal protein S19E (S16A)
MSNLKIEYPEVGEHILFNLEESGSLEKDLSVERSMSMVEVFCLFLDQDTREKIEKTIEELNKAGLIRFEGEKVIITAKGYQFLLHEEEEAEKIAAKILGELTRFAQSFPGAKDLL